MLSLTRHQIFIFVTAIVFSVFFASKLNFIEHAKFTKGRFIGIQETNRSRGIQFIPKIIYSVNGQSYELSGTENTQYNKEWLVIIYENKNPQNAFVYDFMGFWFFGLLICLFVSLLSAAFIYGFMEKKTRVTIKFPFGKKP